MHDSDDGGGAKSTWQRDLAARLGVPVAEVERSMCQLILDEGSSGAARVVKGEDGEENVLVRFPGGYRRIQ